ncbi:Cis-prenyltransferase 7,chloroplastic [Trichinella pseudospiralis]
MFMHCTNNSISFYIGRTSIIKFWRPIFGDAGLSILLIQWMINLLTWWSSMNFCILQQQMDKVQFSGLHLNQSKVAHDDWSNGGKRVPPAA